MAIDLNFVKVKTLYSVKLVLDVGIERPSSDTYSTKKLSLYVWRFAVYMWRLLEVGQKKLQRFWDVGGTCLLWLAD